MNSFPRMAWTIGAFNRPARAMRSAWAPAHPAPPRIVTLVAAFRRPASSAISPSDGRTTGAVRRGAKRGGCRKLDRLGRDVTRQHDHRDAPAFDRGADGDVEDAGHLLGVGDQFAVVAALAEQGFGAGLLEVSGADLPARDVGGDGDHRDAAAVAVVQAVDEVQVPRPATPGARGQFAGELRSAPAANAAASSCRTWTHSRPSACGSRR